PAGGGPTRSGSTPMRAPSPGTPTSGRAARPSSRPSSPTPTTARSGSDHRRPMSAPRRPSSPATVNSAQRASVDPPHTCGRPVRAVYADRGHSRFDILLAAMVTVVILSGIGAAKGVSFGTVPGTGFEIITDGGFFLFPLAYVLGDIVTELYGPHAARRAILTS